jgi:hypothetical protein
LPEEGYLMIRRTTLLVAAAALLATAGCRYCASPYDYCGPLFTGDGCTPCAADSRAGSIYSDQVIPVPSYGAEVMQFGSDELRPVPDQMASGPMPGVAQAASPVTYHGGPSSGPPNLFPQSAQPPHRLTGYPQPAPWLSQR